MKDKPKLVFIPADCISVQMSRSYYLGKYLSNYFDLTWLKWNDPRSIEWCENGETRWYKRLFIWIENLFAGDKLENGKQYNIFYIPFLSNAFIRFILGNVAALKLSRSFNKKTLRRVIKQIEPDLILYADGFYFFPIIEDSNAIIFSDLQDDFDFNSFTKNVKEYEINYFNCCFNLSKKNYIVTESAAINIKKFINTEFSFLPNGAEFKELRNVSMDKLVQYNKRLQLENKIVISFIGGEVWFDKFFVKELVTKSIDLIPNAIFILIGNHPIIESKNVINVGVIPPEETYIYYNLSHIGILPKNTAGNPFLYNAMPLKIIQYSSLGKPFICTFIKWVEENKFSNVFCCDFSVESWIQKIISIGTNKFSDSKWEEYDWEFQCKKIFKAYHEIQLIK
jgi:hypothetical protein